MSGAIQIEIPRAVIEQVAREVFQQMAPTVENAEAAETRNKLARIMAKEFVSISEATFLIGCKDSQMKKMLQQAKEGKSKHPIPALDLDGVATVFNRQELLSWIQGEKTKTRLRDVSAR